MPVWERGVVDNNADARVLELLQWQVLVNTLDGAKERSMTGPTRGRRRHPAARGSVGSGGRKEEVTTNYHTTCIV